jgi:hypothetical protein
MAEGTLPIIEVETNSVKLFGSTFELPKKYKILESIGMGAFGLVWYKTIYTIIKFSRRRKR